MGKRGPAYAGNLRCYAHHSRDESNMFSGGGERFEFLRVGG
jgi:hypothetical protein